MRTKVALAFLSLVLCFSLTGFAAQAASTVETKKTANQNDLTGSSIQPRALLHLMVSQYNDNNTIEVTVNYSINDSNNQIVGIQRAYISKTNDNFVKNAKVLESGIQPNSGNHGLYVKISYEDLSGDVHFLIYYIVP